MSMTLLAQRVLNEVFYPLLKPMIVKYLLSSALVSPLRRLITGPPNVYLPGPALSLSKILEDVERTLTASSGPYVCGAALSYADVALYTNLNLVLQYECFNCDELLSAHPQTARLITAVDEKAAGWMEQRTREHQLGYTSVVEYLAVTNTPFPWGRKKKPYEMTVAFTRGV
uniref:Glutathione S-transferase C-terminal domain-containing protein n=1 Tax=Haptolina brevifila TaxID=156173 RepID=A0A7S2I2G3_9EUKA